MTTPPLREQHGTLILRAGIVVYASEGAAALVGRPVADIVGRRVVDLIVPEQRAAIEERHFRRLRGEVVPAASEVTVLLPGGGRRLVEAHAERDGADVLVHVRDLASSEERRLRLEAVATLGAALQRELAEDAIHARVREGLWELGLSSCVMRADGDRVRIVWASVVPELSARFAKLAGTPLHGYLGWASDFTRRIAADGYAFTDDWADEASRLVPAALAAGVRAAVAEAAIAKAIAVRLEGRAGADLALLVAGDWLRSEDGPAVRLFAAQLAAALDAARTVADLSRRNADLAALNQVAEVAGRATRLTDFFARAADVLRDAVGCRGIAVFVTEEGTGDLVRAYEEGVSPERSRAFERGAAAGRLASMMREGVVRVGDVTPDGAFAHLGVLGYRAIAWVPLVARSKAVGVFAAGFDVPAEEVRGRTELLSAVGAHLAAAVESDALLGDLRRRIEELSLLNEVGRTIAGSLDLARVLREGADAARRLVHASRGFVVLYDAPQDELRVGAAAGFDEGELEAFRGSASGPSISARVVRERRAIVIDDATPAELRGERRAAPGGRALIAAPMLLRGEPLGVVVVDEVGRARRFTPSEVERVGAVANQLAVAIENARLYAEARDRLQELGTVIDVARVVSSSLDLAHVLEAGAEHLARTLEGSACTILLEDPRHQELRRAAARGEPIGPERVPVDAPSLPRDALEARAPVTGRAPFAGGGDGDVLAVPLDVRGRPVGVALVAGGRPGRAFTPGELARATAIASQLAVAVDNAALYSETRRRAEELALLHEVGRSLVATLDIDRVLDAGVRNLARIVEAPDAYLALEVPGARLLEICAVTGSHPEHLGQRFPLDVGGASGNLLSVVFHRREPIVIEDALVDPIVNQEIRGRTGGRGYLGLPLLVRDRAIGAILILEPRAPRLFTPAEVERAAAIANQLAVAVDNARLYEDLRRSYGELARAQQQLVQRERLAALGELSAIVAHEVRNPLGVIFNSLGSLRRLLRPSGDAKLLLDIVGEESERLNRIVGDLLDFARPSTPELHPERLDRVVEDALAAALAQRPGGVEVAREHDARVPPVPMDARLVRQAVLNVAVNAVQAMPRGGRLTVRTRCDGGAAVLEVEDTGAGIPAEVRDRIFEPFFTTKASGTGLGLAVVKRIVEGHGGAVAVASRPGAGTVFALRFPLAAGEVENGPAIG